MAQPILFPLGRVTDAPAIGTTPFLNRLLPAANFVTEYALTLQSRRVAAYRGSYSAISNVGAQPGPGVEFAPQAVARAVAFYEGSASKTGSVLFAAPAADGFASTSPAKSRPNYRGSYSSTSSAADQAGPGADYASMAQSRAQPFYSAPRALTRIQPDFTTALDAWAQTTQGRAAVNYAGRRAVTISVFDPAANTFADWTPIALLSRSVKAYSPPAAQPRVAWGESVVTDAYAQSLASRLVLPYRAPAAFLARAYDQAAAGSTDYVAAILSRQQANYSGSYSLNANAADQAAPGLDWASSFASRAQALYRSTQARAIPVYAAAIIASDSWAQVTQSRRSENYRALRSQLLFEWNTDFCTTLYPDTILLPDDPLYPDLCAQLELGWMTRSRAVARYSGPLSRSMPVYFSPAVIADSWAQVTQSRFSARYRGSYSLNASAVDQAIGAADSWAQAFASRIPLGIVQRRSLAIPVYDPATNSFRDWTPGVIQSRAAQWFASPAAFWAFALDGVSGVEPGGGGYGALMSDEFWHRYHARYEALYKPRYKPTLRKQKR